LRHVLSQVDDAGKKNGLFVDDRKVVSECDPIRDEKASSFSKRTMNPIASFARR